VSGHFKEVYECGHIGAQCRCPDPHKTVINKVGKCNNCLNQKADLDLVPAAAKAAQEAVRVNLLHSKTYKEAAQAAHDAVLEVFGVQA
jgi:hypothetical protein